ncbi:hypothetical protein D3C79_1105260 [compost metagenome]
MKSAVRACTQGVKKPNESSSAVMFDTVSHHSSIALTSRWKPAPSSVTPALIERSMAA